LLCACCRIKPNDEDIKLQIVLAPQINPEKFLALAIRHRVEPLVRHNLKLHETGVFPDKILEALTTRVRNNAIKALRAMRINVQLARLMREHGIPYLPLKGVTVAHRYYGSINLRHANDLDCWIPEQSLDEVRALLTGLGCRSDPENCFDEVEKRGKHHCNFLRQHQHHDVMSHPDGVALEVHWRITSNSNGMRHDHADMFATGESVFIGGGPIVMIEPEAQLLYLCDHGGAHGWYRLKWLADLPQVLESREWDWPKVLDKAKQAKSLPTLLLGLKLAQQLFGWDIPESVATAMKKQPFLMWQLNTVYENLSGTDFEMVYPSVLQGLKHVLYRMSFLLSSKYVRGELTYHFLSHNDLRVIPLPDRLFWVYYFVRPVLIWRQIIKRIQVRHAKSSLRKNA